MRNCLFPVCLLLGNPFLLPAQTPDTSLPRYATEMERLLTPESPAAFPASALTDPPALPVRAMAEWEELQAVVITWQGHSAILTEIARAAREECRVIINCHNTTALQDARATLVNAGVDTTSNVAFLLVPNNSIWVRDYGPNCVYANDVDSLYFIDWRYNRNTRRRDDTIATTLAPYFGVPLYTTAVAPNDLVHTGGNFMSDGMGTAFSSNLILDENAAGNPYGASVKTEMQIDDIMQQFMGIERYIKMEKLPWDEIHHIDMHMKLLDEQTLLVGEYPDSIADGPQIEANIQYVLSNFQSAFGNPYQVVRIPMPPDENGRYPDEPNGSYRTYANAVFVNKTIIVPFYEETYDTTARRIWQESMPGYRIVGIDCNAIIPSLGAIHCITKEVGVPDPLRIVHRPLGKIIQSPWAPNGYFVSATLQHRSGINSARVWYTLDTSLSWQFVDMHPRMPDDSVDVWETFIPRIDSAVGKCIYYYIEATSASGKTQVRPLPAPNGWWRFCVEAAPMSATTEANGPELQSAFPNPASAITCVPVQTSQRASGRLGLFDALGREVITLHEGVFPAGTSRYFFDAGLLPAGVYWLSLQTGRKVNTQAVVIR